MEIIRTIELLRKRVADAKAANKTIGLVPTMGALHDGHLSLIDRARKECDIVVVSDFVNPTQFNNPDDLKTYPRTEAADCSKMEAAGVDYAFIPSVEEIYPEPDTRVFDLGPVAEVMEGAMRPGHFNGVAQIVSKLFAIVTPDKAYFDGLALSSRNVRLSPEARAIAPEINRALRASLDFARDHSVAETRDFVVGTINSKGMETEYYEIVDARTMQPVADWADTPCAVGCVTVYCGGVRLIDNIKYQ